MMMPDEATALRLIKEVGHVVGPEYREWETHHAAARFASSAEIAGACGRTIWRYVMMLADCVDTGDGKKHAVPVGTLVEMLETDQETEDYTGARLYVVHHGRDCDKTPLYWLSPYKDDMVWDDERFANPKWIGGYSEDSFRKVRRK